MTSSRTENTATAVTAPQSILYAVLKALNNGRVSEAIDHFDKHFTFNDYALGLEFTEEERLSEFFQKSREFFPDAVVEVMPVFECGDHAIAEWKIIATEMLHYGSRQFRSSISFLGASVVRIGDGRITHWSDYYDQSQSRRISLAARFTDWIEY